MCHVSIRVDLFETLMVLYFRQPLVVSPKILEIWVFFLTAFDGGAQCLKEMIKLPKKSGQMSRN